MLSYKRMVRIVLTELFAFIRVIGGHPVAPITTILTPLRLCTVALNLTAPKKQTLAARLLKATERSFLLVI